MTTTVPLIVSQEPVTRGLMTKTKLSKPNIAVVYSDGFGRITYLGGRPLSWAEQVASRYRTRYEVDLSDHRRQASLQSSPLPSRGDVYFFRCVVDVGFRVTDPMAVVQRNVVDGLVVVYNFLIDVFRPVTRRYDITDAQGAEEELNQMFLTPAELPEGVTIYRCTTRLTLDDAAQQYLRDLESAQREIALGSARHGVDLAAVTHVQEIGGIEQQGRFDSEDRERQVQRRRAIEDAEQAMTLGVVQHRVDVAATRHAQVIDTMKQQARLESEERELAAMVGRSANDWRGIIEMHLARHPDETRYALELLSGHEQARLDRADQHDNRTIALIKYMADQGLIQAVDVEKLRTNALDRVAEITGPEPPAAQAAYAASSWDDPLSTPRRAIPVYVVVDESVADPSYFDALNNSIQALPSELAGHRDVADAVRLALIGYAGGVDVRMPLNAVGTSSYVPAFSRHDGSDLAAVFDDLHARIPADIERLKSQGMTLGRPLVHLLRATPASDKPDLVASFQRLTDPATFPYVPTIIPCGIGRTPPESVGAIATHPQLAWVAAPETPVREAMRYYLAFVRTSIVNLSEAHLRGEGNFIITGPTGFRSASKGGDLHG